MFNENDNPKNNKEILAENKRLKAELAALRGQIDGMQQRSDELMEHNRDLQDQVEKIKLKKDELENLQLQKDDLFAIIIHDIKNPASLIKSLVGLLTSYDLSAMEQQEVIGDIVETTQRIVKLSAEVSKVLSLESSDLKLKFEQAQINEIITDVFRINNAGAEAKEITMTHILDPDLPEAEIDPQKIAEVIDNLLSNAIKFSDKGGSIQVTTKKVDYNIVVDVKDTGLGLSEDDIRRAFQKGARLSAKPTKGESSTGLGLWIIKKLVESHNGRVWVRSSLGKGSIFSFSVPIKQIPED